MATKPAAVIRHRSMLIRQFIIETIHQHPSDIARVVSEHFKITTQGARNHLSALESEGVLKSSGKTKAKVYSLQTISTVKQVYAAADLAEDVVWSQNFKPHLTDASENVVSICGIAFL